MVLRRLAGALLVLALTACSGSGTEPGAERSASASLSETPTETSEAISEETAPSPPAPTPRVGQCRRLGVEAAAAPTSRTQTVPCAKAHTAETFHVGQLDLVEAGHWLAVDSPAVQQQPREGCSRALARHLGVEDAELRLTMARTVWFTPTVEEAAAGARWFRCDLVVVDGPDRLARLPRRTKGSGAGEAVAMCGTRRPGTSGFARVPCARRHTWRAVAAVDLPGKRFPTPSTAAEAMSGRCRDEARTHSADALDFDWSEERPTRAQWRTGQRYGICWVPTSS